MRDINVNILTNDMYAIGTKTLGKHETKYEIII